MKAKSIALLFFLAAAVADCDSRTGPPATISVGAGDTTRDTTPPPPPPPPGDTTPPPPPPPPPGDTTPPPPPPPPPGGSVAVVRIVPESATVISGDTGVYLYAVALDSAGNRLPRNANWSTSDSNVLYLASHIGEAIRVLGRAAGVARVFATVDGQTGASTITVRRGAPVARVVVDPARIMLSPRDRRAFRAHLTDAAGTVLKNRAVSWSSSDTMTAAIFAIDQWDGDSYASIEARSPGTVVLRATSEGQTGEAVITVYAPGTVASVSVTPSSASLAVGDSAIFSAELRDAAGNILAYPSPFWTASDTSTVRLWMRGSEAIVYGLRPGNVTLAAIAEGKRDTASVVVR